MRHIIATAGSLVRATVWTEHGTSSKTFATASEARGWVAVAANRKPVPSSRNNSVDNPSTV